MTPQLHITTEATLRPEVQPVRNFSVKPKGGFWTSTYCDGRSEWVDACQDMFESAYQKNWFLLVPSLSARILQINSLADLKYLLRTAPNPCPRTHIVWLDFEALAHSYDAITLTTRGQIETRLTWPETLYGWDSESTLWFRWMFLDVQRIATPEAR